MPAKSRSWMSCFAAIGDSERMHGKLAAVHTSDEAVWNLDIRVNNVRLKNTVILFLHCKIKTALTKIGF